jgi:microcystin-dependent protein
MATVTGYTAERMKAIEDSTVVAGTVDPNGDLILETRDGTDINAGAVKGDKGDKGDVGPQGDPGTDGRDGEGVPVGCIMPFAGIIAPAGWLWCDGSAVSRTAYSDLFGVISSLYGAGDGSTTFNVPDMRGRVPVCQDNMSGNTPAGAGDGGRLAAGAMAGSGGSETTTLTAAQMPSHNHATTAAGNHAHLVAGSNLIQHKYPSSSEGLQAAGNGTRTTGSAMDAAGNHTHPISNTGGGAAHPNMPPYLLMNYIIKA